MMCDIRCEDINIIYSDIMPIGINGHLIVNHDGSYTIFINAKISSNHQQEALEHELDHIRRDDFYSDYGDVQYIESEIRSG